MKGYHIITFGCQMNAHDSEKIAGLLELNGYVESIEPKDSELIIINTCSIRKKAEDKFFSQLGRYKKLKTKKKDLKIVVTGCIAQQEGERIIKRAPYVDFVIGPQNIHLVGNLDTNQRILTSENIDISTLSIDAKRNIQTKALINIMYGCNNFCSYCVVPYTRGREKSRASNEIIEEIKGLTLNGYKEFTLLGQNVNSYKSDINFVELLKKIEDIEDVVRIRFMTSHPKDLSDELIKAFKDFSKLCEHIHLPLQSGSNKILFLMNRKYTYEEYLKKIYKLREYVPDISITTDIITGFPSETEEDHLLTLKALQEIQFDGIFSFKYSLRPGTKSAFYEDNVDINTKNRRLNEINQLQDEITDKKNELLKNNKLEILIEGPSDKPNFKLMGRTRGNKIVYLNSHNNSTSYGNIVNVIIKHTHRHSLEAEYIEDSNSHTRL